jgi:CheY-like chemotaxis protein
MSKLVLYVDDEANTEKMASKFEILKDEGIDVAAVTRVSDVLPEIARLGNAVNLIVLDLIMPPENIYSLGDTDGGTTTGLRLLQDIRNKYSNVPVMIVSIRRRTTMREDLMKRYGVVEYLEKPVTAYEIAVAIKKALGEPVTEDTNR